jgi:hypothetical protein
VTHPDYQTTFDYLKKRNGLTQAEQELAVLEAEKKGQESLNSSLAKRDASMLTLEPTGVPDGGADISEEMAREILGDIFSKRTIDEEKMEYLLRDGNPKGWEMFKWWQKAHEKLGMPIPEPEDHWRKSA